MKTKNLSTLSVILISFAVSFSALSFEDAVRRQVIQSEAFLDFKRDRMQQLWRSTTDNPYIQCLRDEHARIPAPRPTFSDYYSVRHPIYVSLEATHIINKAEACVEHEYELTRCKLKIEITYVIIQFLKDEALVKQNLRPLVRLIPTAPLRMPSIELLLMRQSKKRFKTQKKSNSLFINDLKSLTNEKIFIVKALILREKLTMGFLPIL